MRFRTHGSSCAPAEAPMGFLYLALTTLLLASLGLLEVVAGGTLPIIAPSTHAGSRAGVR
jgi:hypothetical protein